MAVWCRQRADGEPDQLLRIEPHFADQSDAELLERKFEGAHDKGWSVERTARGFDATKVRWGGVVCVREFWIE